MWDNDVRMTAVSRVARKHEWIRQMVISAFTKRIVKNLANLFTISGHPECVPL
jgi:hypothetical protein